VDGNFDWAEPDEAVHAFCNELERTIGTYLFGRRMYEVMRVWEDLDTPEQSPLTREFAKGWLSSGKDRVFDDDRRRHNRQDAARAQLRCGGGAGD
jgi:hypothetical protein